MVAAVTALQSRGRSWDLPVFMESAPGRASGGVQQCRRKYAYAHNLTSPSTTCASSVCHSMSFLHSPPVVVIIDHDLHFIFVNVLILQLHLANIFLYRWNAWHYSDLFPITFIYFHLVVIAKFMSLKFSLQNWSFYVEFHGPWWLPLVLSWTLHDFLRHGRRFYCCPSASLR